MKPWIETRSYDELTKIELHDVDALLEHGLVPKVGDNAHAFSGFVSDVATNLATQAISPFSGAHVPPVQHFGVDADPWMHAILFADEGRPFVVICQDLTPACVLGGILLPQAGIMLENRGTWYYRDIFQQRIRWNLPRITSFLQALGAPVVATYAPPIKLVPAIGNRRIGDFFLQLAWLCQLLDGNSDGKRCEIDRILVNRTSDFFDLTELFEDYRDRILVLDSTGHVEYYARGTQATLVSCGVQLSDRAAVELLKARIRAYVRRHACPAAVAGELEVLRGCAASVWLSLDSEKRVFVEQRANLTAVLERFFAVPLGPDGVLGLVFNGMTGTEGGGVPQELTEVAAREREIAAEIAADLSCDARLIDLSGRSLREKAHFAARAGFVLAPVGSASVLPSLIFDRPGLVYGYKGSRTGSFAGEETVLLSDQHVSRAADVKGRVDWGNDSSVSYSIRLEPMLEALERNFRLRWTEGERSWTVERVRSTVPPLASAVPGGQPARPGSECEAVS